MSEPRPRAASPDEKGGRVGALVGQLREHCRGTFAGAAYARDGVLEVYSTGDPEINAIVAHFAAQNADPQVRVVAGRRNSLDDLEAVRDRVHARMRAGDLPVRVLELGVNILGNCVRVGIDPLSEDSIALLTREFGDALCVVQGQMFGP